MTTDGSASDILAIAETWAGEGREIALATVIETWGSAPRPVGQPPGDRRAGSLHGIGFGWLRGRRGGQRGR